MSKLTNTFKTWTFWLYFSALLILVSAIAFKFTDSITIFDYIYAVAMFIILGIAALFIGYAIIWFPITELIKYVSKRRE